MTAIDIPAARIDYGAKVFQVSSSNRPRVEPQKIADLPQEQQEAIRTGLKEVNDRIAEHNRKIAEMEQYRLSLQNEEVRSHIAPNVVSLSKEQALRQIEYMSGLIQSGEAEKTPLFTGNGSKATSNYRQYVSWLQQHVKALEGATPVSSLSA